MSMSRAICPMPMEAFPICKKNVSSIPIGMLSVTVHQLSVHCRDKVHCRLRMKNEKCKLKNAK